MIYTVLYMCFKSIHLNLRYLEFTKCQNSTKKKKIEQGNKAIQSCSKYQPNYIPNLKPTHSLFI